MNKRELEKLNIRESKQSIIKRLSRDVVRPTPKNSLPTIVEMIEFKRIDCYELNQTEFAKILGMSKSHYSEFIHGKRELPINSLRRAYAIGCSADVLLAIRK